MKQIITILLSFLVLVAPVVAAVESTETLPVEPGLTPDHWAYGLDRFMERMQYSFAGDDAAKAQLKFQFAEERLAELETVVNSGKNQYAEQLALEYQNGLDETDTEVEKAVALGKDMTSLVERVTAMKAKHLAVLQDVYDKVPEQARSGIMNAIQASTQQNAGIISRIREQEQLRTHVEDDTTSSGETETEQNQNEGSDTQQTEEEQNQNENSDTQGNGTSGNQ